MKKTYKYLTLFAASFALISCGPKTESSIQTYSVTLDANGGVFLDGETQKVFTVEKGSKVADLEKPTYENHEFKCWSSIKGTLTQWAEETPISKDLSLFAYWDANPFTLTVESDNDDQGHVSGSGTYAGGSEVTVEAYPADGFAFDGWYINDVKVSANAVYTFEMPFADTSIRATFCTSQYMERVKMGASPFYWPETNTVTYGRYPQSKASAQLSATLDNEALNLGNGYYEYNGQTYIHIAAHPCGDSYEFDDGTPVVDGTEYWFRVERISWNVLSTSEGEYFLAAEKALDHHEYSENFGGTKSRTDVNGFLGVSYANNWRYSPLRTWLNKDFYTSAFDLDNSYVKKVTVRNDAASTGNAENQYACPDTEDNVYALSYEELNSKELNLWSNDKLDIEATDYARATGISITYSVNNPHSASYFTRSPSPSSEYQVSAWRNTGNIVKEAVDSYWFGVRPAITISC